MDTANVPVRINARLDAQDRQAVATIASALATPHRRHANITETIKAALSIAAEAVQARNASAVAAARS